MQHKLCPLPLGTAWEPHKHQMVTRICTGVAITNKQQTAAWPQPCKWEVLQNDLSLLAHFGPIPTFLHHHPIILAYRVLHKMRSMNNLKHYCWLLLIEEYSTHRSCFHMPCIRFTRIQMAEHWILNWMETFIILSINLTSKTDTWASLTGAKWSVAPKQRPCKRVWPMWASTSAT